MTAQTTSWCLPLSLSAARGLPSTAALDVNLVGQKAWNLARLAAAGLPVPPAFAVSARALDRHLHSGGLRADIDHIVAALHRGDVHDGAAFAIAAGSIAWPKANLPSTPS
jgi:pyruvate,water dikinase